MDNYGEWLLTSAIGGTVVAIIQHFVIARIDRENTRKNKKVERVIDHINQLSKLTQLYRNYGHYSVEVIVDEKGNLLKDDEGKATVSARIMHPDDKWLEEFKNLEEKNLESVIFSHRYYINVETSEVNDILHELDNTGNFYTEFASFRVSVFRLQEILNRRKIKMSLDESNNIFIEFMGQLRKIDKERRLLREKASSYHR